MAEIILHHYDTSPFSEKPRIMFGVKGQAWRSVIQPVIMPKPDLIPLTGGYRRIPVMQIGADVYCDTQVILAELERRQPAPKVVQGAGDWAVNLNADRTWFQATVVLVFGAIGDSVPKEFLDDREKLSGRPFDMNALKAAGPMMRPAWRAQVEKIENDLKADFLGGSAPSLADIASYMNVWWLGGAAPGVLAEMLDGLPKTQAWRDRVRAIGHGTRSDMTPGEALDAARAAEPIDAPAHDPKEADGMKPGDKVAVAADDYGKDPIAGALVAVTADRITLAREDADLGHLHVHFPRSGYILAGA